MESMSYNDFFFQTRRNKIAVNSFSPGFSSSNCYVNFAHIITQEFHNYTLRKNAVAGSKKSRFKHYQALFCI